MSPADDVTQRLMSPLEVREHLKLLWNNEKDIIELIYSNLVKGTGMCKIVDRQYCFSCFN